MKLNTVIICERWLTHHRVWYSSVNLIFSLSNRATLSASFDRSISTQLIAYININTANQSVNMIQQSFYNCESKNEFNWQFFPLEMILNQCNLWTVLSLRKDMTCDSW